MDGVKLAHFVRDRWPPVKVIATSGHARIAEDVLGDHRRRTVIDEEARNKRLERHRFFVAGIDLQRRGGASGSGRVLPLYRVEHSQFH